MQWSRPRGVQVPSLVRKWPEGQAACAGTLLMIVVNPKIAITAPKDEINLIIESYSALIVVYI